MIPFNSEELRRIIFPRVKSLTREDCFCHYLDENFFEEDQYHWDELEEKVQADDSMHGASKFVFCYDDLPDWVVKVPLFGNIYLDEYDNYITEEYTGALDYLHPFGVELDLSQANNYCETENIIASYTRTHGFSKFFAQTYFLGMVNDIPIYVSENAPVDEDRFYDKTTIVSEKSASKAKEIYNNTRAAENSLSMDIILSLVECYDINAIIGLIRFIKTMRILDLHNYNFGVGADNKIKIIDYSGFNN